MSFSANDEYNPSAYRHTEASSVQALPLKKRGGTIEHHSF